MEKVNGSSLQAQLTLWKKSRVKRFDVEEILDLVDDWKNAGNGWLAICPAHDDNRHSLSIGEGTEQKLLLHCHAGCKFLDIISALRKQRDGKRGCK